MRALCFTTDKNSLPPQLSSATVSSAACFQGTSSTVSVESSMEHYPTDLLAGVVPLVFAVNAVDRKYDTSSWSTPDQDQRLKDIPEPAANTGGPFNYFLDAISALCKNEEYDGSHYVNKSANTHRANEGALEAVTGDPRRRADSAPEVRLGEGDFSHEILSGEDSSDDEEGTALPPSSPIARNFSNGLAEEMRKRIGSINRGISFNNKHKQNQQLQQQQGGDTKVELLHSSLHELPDATTPTFFERVRIIPVSKRHAFPPSKDPSGVGSAGGISTTSSAPILYGTQYDTGPFSARHLQPSHSKGPFMRRKVPEKSATNSENHPLGFNHATAADIFRGAPSNSFDVQVHPALSTEQMNQKQQHQQHHGGILPIDWLEKHSQWLPSIVVVVTVLDLNLPQAKRIERDVDLGEIMENLRISLASKRECRIHLVCLVTNHSHLKTAQQKYHVESQHLTNLRSQCRLAPSCITLLHLPTDLEDHETSSFSLSTSALLESPATEGLPSITKTRTPSLALQQLHRTMRSISMSYYLSAARRMKRKLAMIHTLSSNAGTPLEHNYHLLPMVTRCQFKIGIYYEFQQKLDKCVRHLNEAYNALELYYRFIVNQQRHVILQQKMMHRQQQQQLEQEEEKVKDPLSTATYNDTYADLAPLSPPPHTRTTVQTPTMTEDGAVEVALIMDSPPAANDDMPYPSTPKQKHQEVPFSPPGLQMSSSLLSDMAYQCRGVADWINFKLMMFAFQYSSSYSNSLNQYPGAIAEKAATDDSNKEGGGLVHATMQWRRHCQIFLSTQYYRTDESQLFQPLWWHWSYVAHQRWVMAQIAERYPHRSTDLGGTSGPFGEVLLTCASWRLYEAAAEATLQTKRALAKLPAHDGDEMIEHDSVLSSCSRYVGGMNPDMLKVQFLSEAGKPHTLLAFQHLERAISIFYQEHNGSDTWEIPSDAGRHVGRLAARMHFLAGSILMSLDHSYRDAAVRHLQHSLSQVMGWPSLEAAIAKVLVKCYSTEEAWREDIIANALTFLFRPDIFRLLERWEIKLLYNGIVGAPLSSSFCLRWPEENQGKAPLTFSLTFLEGACHATAGDPVSASLSVTSNCSFPLCIKSLEIFMTSSVFGNDPVDVVIPKVDGEGIHLPPRKSMVFHVKLQLPRAQSGTDTQSSVGGVGAPGSVLRSAKSKTAGLTRAAGAVLTAQHNSTAQSQAVHGGRSLNCREISVLLIPLVSKEYDVKSRSPVRLIFSCCRDIFKQNVDYTSSTNKISKNLADEDNYVMSAWSRPSNVPLCRGPSCLRILSPTSCLKVTDVTAAETNSKAIDGTINRIYVRLQAGEAELCENVKLKVIAVRNSSVSEAMVVVEDDTRVPSSYPRIKSIPLGWKLRDLEKVVHVCDVLEPGKEALIYIDFFRPLPSAPFGAPSPSMLEECETHYELEFAYYQRRQNHSSQESLKIHSPIGDRVSYRHQGQLRWFPPMSAQFIIRPQMNEKTFPLGSVHPRNIITSDNTSSSASEGAEAIASEGELMTVRCCLEAPQSQDGLAVEACIVTFEIAGGKENLFIVELVSPSGLEPGAVLSSHPNDIGQVLYSSSKLGLSYTVRATLKGGGGENFDDVGYCETLQLGILKVEWKPVSIYVQQEDNSFCQKLPHGPLALDGLVPIRFLGPLCKVEKVPFNAGLVSFCHTAKVALPFEVSYWIKNNTPLHQKLSVSMSDADPSDREVETLPSDGILVSGFVNGDIVLAPNETTTLCYSALAFKAGKTFLPSFTVTSARYQSWVIKDGQPNPRQLYVLP